MVNIHMLKAFEGDFFWISYGNGKSFSHILIDGGTKECGSKYAGIIERIAKAEQQIEAIILTHVDYDHIAGACVGIAKVESDILKKSVKRILFNASEEIHDEIKTKSDSMAHGIKDGIRFLDVLEKKGIRNRLINGITLGQTIHFESGAVIKIISPGQRELEKFLKSWEKYEETHSSISHAANVEQMKQNLEDLMLVNMGTDSSVNNASSIAFMFEYSDVKGVFLADAKPSVCVEGLKAHGIESRYPVDFIKISHHGSMTNTNARLLEMLQTENFLLSTNGNGAKVPAKAVIAKLLRHYEKVRLFCNYDWWETVYHRKYFTKKDKEVYFDTNKLRLFLLNDEGTKIKDGLQFYEDEQVL